MLELKKGFKRLNFFEGFVTTPDDWNQGDLYHVNKHRLHNRSFHGVGIVPGQLRDFKVTSRGKGEMAVEIHPGYCVDGRGNDIILWETEIRQFVKSDYKLPQTVYLVAKYVEELSDFVAYKENLNYKGHTRVSEVCKVDWSITPPDTEMEIELARIHVTPDCKRFMDARNPNGPEPNEIDLRFRPVAGVAGGFMSAEMAQTFRELMRRNREYYASLAYNRGIHTANNVVLALTMMEMMLSASGVGPSTFLDLMGLVLEMQKRVVSEVEKDHPGLSSRKRFRDHKSELDLVERLVGDRREAITVLDDMLKHQAAAVDHLEMTTREVAGPTEAAPKAAAKPTEGGFSWDTIKEFSGDPPKHIKIEGIDWELVDQINITDPSSEREHNFRIHGEKDSWHTRQRLKYPDGTTVDDAGVAHVDGYAEFEIRNLKPQLDLLILRRMDFVHGDHEADIEINGVKAGKLICQGSDKRFRWRNWPVVVKGKYVRSNTVTMRQVATSAERDINIFRLWFYQAV
ncbi:MAG: hypothetical protein JW797_10925 [Bradymonadales bacterium]|nr:hypothetical protein [Bradymonadales bacterium]